MHADLCEGDLWAGGQMSCREREPLPEPLLHGVGPRPGGPHLHPHQLCGNGSRVSQGRLPSLVGAFSSALYLEIASLQPPGGGENQQMPFWGKNMKNSIYLFDTATHTNERRKTNKSPCTELKQLN
jgi:hypothetical protein